MATVITLCWVLVLLSSVSVHAAVVNYKWTVTNTTQRLDGVLRYALGINGSPGYKTAIEVNSGDIVVVEVTNGLQVPTSIHWHGLYQIDSNAMDGPVGATQCAIAPGRTYTYRFSTAGQQGTYWWHAHHRAQYTDGLRGPFVIRGRNEYIYQDDQTIQLADWYHEQSESLIDYYLNVLQGDEPVFQSGLINGRGKFDCAFTMLDCQDVGPAWVNVTYGRVTRLRVINMGAFAAFRFSIDGHSMTVIEVDGISVKPYVVDEFTINIAQRYSVLITATQHIGNYWIRATMYHNSPWTSAPDPQGFNPNVLAVLSYSGASQTTLPNTLPNNDPKVLVDSDLAPLRPITPPRVGPADIRLVFTFEFTGPKSTPNITFVGRNLTIGASYVAPHVPTLIAITNKLALPETSNIINVNKGQVVEMLLINDDAGEHPFHLHGHTFWVMASGVGGSLSDLPRSFNNSNPLRRDTLTLPACPIGGDGGCLPNQFGYAIIRFIARAGVWLFHCHIEWHIVAGLVATFVVAQEEMAERRLPPISAQTCADLDAWQAGTLYGSGVSTSSQSQSTMSFESFSSSMASSTADASSSSSMSISQASSAWLESTSTSESAWFTSASSEATSSSSTAASQASDDIEFSVTATSFLSQSSESVGAVITSILPLSSAKPIVTHSIRIDGMAPLDGGEGASTPTTSHQEFGIQPSPTPPDEQDFATKSSSSYDGYYFASGSSEWGSWASSQPCWTTRR
ncbi:hypothetical protein HDU76_000116 [Blyttiomyces sp. JEL0837]|nr:hypothetical protein HDU76_000116 [Blyttiomyces sp. JEL0837]